MKARKHRRLTAKIAAMCVTIAIIICFTISVTGYFHYRNSIYQMYNSFAYEIADTSAAYVDGNVIADYTTSMETDAGYDIMAENLYKIYKNSSASSIYICIPDPDTLTITNVYDVRIEEADNPEVFALGVVDPIGTANPQTPVDIFLTGELSNDYFIRETSFGFNTSAIIPILNSAGVPTALLSVDVPMLTIEDNLHKYLLYTIGVTALVVIVCILILTILLQRQVVGPIKLVSDEAADFIKTNNSISKRLPGIHTGDEIEQLAGSIYQMEQDINHYIENLTAVTAEKERIAAELDVAKNIQASMLPCIFPAFPDRNEFDIYASMTPAKEVGGDFYDFFLIDEDHLAIVIADVSGKGVPAALFMVISKTLIKNSAQTGLSPKQVLEKVNNQLCENNEAEMFVTVWLGIYEMSSGKLVATNAGHEYPVIKRMEGEYELVKDKHGLVLAGMEGSHYREYELILNPGDKLFLYTDGVPEATDANNELFGTERMTNALNKNKQCNCEELLKKVQEEINAFVKEAPQFDDITMLCFEIIPQQEKKDDKISIIPDAEATEIVNRFVEDIMVRNEIPLKTMARINTAVDEIFSNIVKYSGADQAVVECHVADETITLRFTDNGKEYDPTVKEDPDTSLSAEQREIGGLGIYMVKKTMDQVKYKYLEGQNILTLKKRI